MSRLTWILPKKRGRRRTGSKFAGNVGEAAFYLLLFVLGCAGLITLVSSYFSRSWPVEYYFPTIHFARAEAVIDDGRVREVHSRSGAVRFDPQLKLRFEAYDRPRTHWLSIARPQTTREQAQGWLDTIKPGQQQELWFDPQQPSRSTLVRPRTWGLWLAALLLLGLVSSGVFGVIRVALIARTSVERRQALAKAARSKIQLAEGSTPLPVQFPTVPFDGNLTNSPGIKLKYRLPAVQEPAWRLFGAAIWMLTCLALAASLTVVAIEQHVAGHPRWFLSGFSLLVAALALWATYYFLRELVSTSWIGPTTMEISAVPLLPGGTYEVYFNQLGSLTIERLRLLLACDEETTYLQGTDIRRDVQRVYQAELCARDEVEIDAANPLEATLPLAIPPLAMHSYKSRFNALNWKLVVEIEAEGWPSYQRSFPLVVNPHGKFRGTH